MNDILISSLSALAGAVLPGLLIYLWNMFLPGDQVYSFGFRMMKVIMVFTLEKVGQQQGQKIIDRVRSTLKNLLTGMLDATKLEKRRYDYAKNR